MANLSKVDFYITKVKGGYQGIKALENGVLL